jgi:hypothetical protein
MESISRACSTALSAFVGTLIGGFVGLYLFGHPFGMGSGNEDLVVGLCALLGGIIGITTEPNRKPTGPSTAWRLGRAVRRAGDYFRNRSQA